MSAVSFNLTRGQASFAKDQNVGTGTNAPGTGDVELRVNTTAGVNWSRKDLLNALDVFRLYIQNGMKSGGQTGILP
jgi:hypothetical protein